MQITKKRFQTHFDKKRTYELDYSDERDLSDGIVSICKTLNVGTFVIQLFLGDSISESICSMEHKTIRIGNFCYYLVSDINFIKNINLYRTRFLNIFSIKESDFHMEALKNIPKISAFALQLDNYLEYTEITIDLSRYKAHILEDLHL